MWLFRSGEDGEAPVIIFKYSETRAGDTAVEFLQGLRGYLMCDGYSGYNKVPDAKRTACWAHIRRYLTDAIPKGKELDYSQPSVQGIMYINQLFHMEEVIKAKQTSFDAIKKARLEKEKPIVEGFLSWLDKQNPVRGSRMDKAVTYIVSAKYSYGFPNPQDSSIIVAVRYLDYFTTMMEDRLWQVIAKPVFLWQNRSGLLMNAARAA